jgi:FkbM family methyltransferase
MLSGVRGLIRTAARNDRRLGMLTTMAILLSRYSWARNIMLRCKSKTRSRLLRVTVYSFIADAVKRGMVSEGNIHCSDEGILVPLRINGVDTVVEIFEEYFQFSYSGRILRFYSSWEQIGNVILDNFFSNIYSDLDLGGRIVIDVGAGIGDTPILFAIRGASKVYALEPFPAIHRVARLNVTANKIDNIILLKAAIGSKDDMICSDLGSPSIYKIFAPSQECSEKIRVYSLETLLKEIGVSDGAVLKMDCEGCEYHVLGSASRDVLRTFDQMLIEYHKGYRPIAKILERVGFKNTIKPLKQNMYESWGYILSHRL